MITTEKVGQEIKSVPLILNFHEKISQESLPEV